jgi:hypothetical protein
MHAAILTWAVAGALLCAAAPEQHPGPSAPPGRRGGRDAAGRRT